jgi:hypothetical protein
MKKFITLLLVLSTVGVFSQEIITDRPDQTEASSTVPKNSFQIEMGILTQTSDDNSTTNFAGPSTLIRYGISEKVELRLFNQFESNKIELEGGNVKGSGLSDIEIGTKIQLFKKEGVNTEIAFLSHAIIPTAKDELSNNSLGTINKLSISHVISDQIGIGYNVGYDYINKTSAFTYSVAIGFALAEKFGVYIEPYGALAEGNQFESNFDAGFTYLAKNNLQFDISYGTGLNNDMQYISAGFSWNIPQFLMKNKEN